MKSDKTLYILIFILVIMFFSPFTLASWTILNPPLTPRDDIPRTCTEWILYYRFTSDNFYVNRQKSKIRDFRFDKNVSTWAAIYAYAIGGIGQPPDLLPQAFCDYIGAGDHVYRFKAIKDEKRTCEDWIFLYGFTASNTHHNYLYAKNQHFVKNYEISLWADNYTEYLARAQESSAVTPSYFCVGMGKAVGSEAILMPFMSRRHTKLSCEEWIKLYEFTDNISYNIFKGQIKYSQIMNVHIHFWVKGYAKYLRDMAVTYIIENAITPKTYCKNSFNSKNSEFFTYYFYYPLDKLET